MYVLGFKIMEHTDLNAKTRAANFEERENDIVIQHSTRQISFVYCKFA